jgi:hypothetical protein
MLMLLVEDLQTAVSAALDALANCHDACTALAKLDAPGLQGDTFRLATEAIAALAVADPWSPDMKLLISIEGPGLLQLAQKTLAVSENWFARPKMGGESWVDWRESLEFWLGVLAVTRLGARDVGDALLARSVQDVPFPFYLPDLEFTREDAELSRTLTRSLSLSPRRELCAIMLSSTAYSQLEAANYSSASFLYELSCRLSPDRLEPILGKILADTQVLLDGDWTDPADISDATLTRISEDVDHLAEARNAVRDQDGHWFGTQHDAVLRAVGALARVFVHTNRWREARRLLKKHELVAEGLVAEDLRNLLAEVNDAIAEQADRLAAQRGEANWTRCRASSPIACKQLPGGSISYSSWARAKLPVCGFWRFSIWWPFKVSHTHARSSGRRRSLPSSLGRRGNGFRNAQRSTSL